jgi:hypothetical protein
MRALPLYRRNASLLVKLTDAGILASASFGDLGDARKDVHWRRENQGGVLFHSDFSQCLKIAQLDTDRFLRQQTGCIYSVAILSLRSTLLGQDQNITQASLTLSNTRSSSTSCRCSSVFSAPFGCRMISS